MLSTQSRLRAEFLCSRIAARAEVPLADMAWLQGLSDRNPTVASWLRKARRSAVQGDAPADGLDAFLAGLDLGDPDPSNHLQGPQDPETLARWFSARQAWFRGQG